MLLSLRYGTLIAVFFPVFNLLGQAVLPPPSLEVTPYERHFRLRWEASPTSGVTSYKIFRSTDGGNTFQFLKQTGKNTYSFDWTGDEGMDLTYYYQVTAVKSGASESTPSPTAGGTTFTMNDEQLLDMVEEASFRYFWDFGHPVSGLARERNLSGDLVTIGGSGFGIMAIIAGADRGWITRDQAVNRMIQIASFLQFSDRFHGAFPHWMNGVDGNIIPFSQYDNGGDLIETAFLMQGLLTAREYFDEDTPLESALRDVITDLWEDVEWDWYRKNNSNVLYWHWSPNYAWQMNFQIRGFNEGQIAYILAAASPTHGVPGSLYQTGWAGSGYVNNSVHYGRKIFTGPYAGGPMFFAHYSYLGFDPRNKKDQYCNYFIRNRNHALIQRDYCAANPENHAGYSANCWGLTASDNPWGYLAHSPYPTNDNGTIAPTAALASMPYTPDESIAAMRHFYRELGQRLWGDFGFYDAFNLDEDWYANSYLAIDQGPIVVMMENYRSGLFWNKFMQNPEIQPALTAIGFIADGASDVASTTAIDGFDAQVSPNPAIAGKPVQVALQLERPMHLTADLYDLQGRVISGVLDQQAVPAGTTVITLQHRPAQGLYFLRFTDESGHTNVKTINF